MNMPRGMAPTGQPTMPMYPTMYQPMAPDLMKKVFYNLYETDIIFEDAYVVWREDVVDETPGKNTALFQVNEFLQWLSIANE
ncbi:eukaryotic translation initiation factor 4 gamma 2 [Chrysochromulina tobinii]|uniref:Eukaryotic translation initiation factor 4 gamma 2 n=1 Tax=Chrysochromulina tobinii TaxID=1460289 RepID=A0A0M0LQW3_9EUKA|nr:eukaryotic translation initiation factor 4 gamma 2 [Chrysochromulina tobinii]|eukprot:KOO53292.1 eukaryotic translation initiation factor 4 gamma 2 [Chrysochromulina sp. CCMP291]